MEKIGTVVATAVVTSTVIVMLWSYWFLAPALVAYVLGGGHDVIKLFVWGWPVLVITSALTLVGGAVAAALWSRGHRWVIELRRRRGH